MSTGIFDGMTLTWGDLGLTKAKPPAHLPDPSSLVTFDMAKKKAEIFEAVRERVKAKAQHTKNGRKPWTQVTVPIPIKPGSTEDEDLALIWEVMKGTTRDPPKENSKGDLTWHFWSYLEWLGIDDSLKPKGRFVHPILFDTGDRKRTVLRNKIRKAEREAAQGLATDLARYEAELEEYEEKLARKKQQEQSEKEPYHWAAYDECAVTYKKKQGRKCARELQLTVRVRTYYLGSGDPRENNGYLGGCSDPDLLDPESQLFKLLKMMGR